MSISNLKGVEADNSYAVVNHHVTIKAEYCRQIDGGKWVVELQARALSDSEHEFLFKLFPHHGDQLTQMMGAEALIAAVQK